MTNCFNYRNAKIYLNYGELNIHFDGGYDFFINFIDSRMISFMIETINKGMSSSEEKIIRMMEFDFIIEQYNTHDEDHVDNELRFNIYFDRMPFRVCLDFKRDELESFANWLNETLSDEDTFAS